MLVAEGPVAVFPTPVVDCGHCAGKPAFGRYLPNHVLTVPRPSTGMAPRGIMAKVRAQKMPSVSLVKGLDLGRAAEDGFQIRKDREGIEVEMHKGEIFDIR